MERVRFSYEGVSVSARIISVLATFLLCCGVLVAGAGASPEAKKRCHPSYKGACLDPKASDYDCIGGHGNGPKYTGKVRVVGPDVFRLDADHDGWGCE
jgi:hypothetical protein